MVELGIRTLVSIVLLSLGLGLFIGLLGRSALPPRQPKNRRLGLDEFSDPKSIVGKTADFAYRDDVTMDSPSHADEMGGDMDSSSLFVGDAPYVAHVSTMCRCSNGQLPRPIFPDGNPFLGSANGRGGSDVGVYQWPSRATGPAAKMFSHHPIEECICNKDRKRTQKTTDMYLKLISHEWFVSRRCPQFKGTSDWLRMPDLGVEKLPLFVGVLSYESPLSLQNSLRKWAAIDLFNRIRAQNVFIQLNHRSSADDEVLSQYQESLPRKLQHPFQAMGSAEENLHPGLAISRFCRMAEASEQSHPNGENLLLFLEKDWTVRTQNESKHSLEEIFFSANALLQRGVDVVRLKRPFKETDQAEMWDCPAYGVHWKCAGSHQQRWSNQPMIIRCDWYLRYLEPFALLSIVDPIMRACNREFDDPNYCDWEAAIQDGRVAWTNSQWVVASAGEQNHIYFDHEEVDGD